MYNNKTSLFFTIDSDILSPSEISKIIWLDCDKFWIKWEEVITPNWIRTGFLNKKNYWTLTSTVSPWENWDIHVQQMLDRIEVYKNNLNLIKDCKKKLSIGIQYKEEVPWFHFDLNLLRRIENLCLDIDISLYDMKI